MEIFHLFFHTELMMGDSRFPFVQNVLIIDNNGLALMENVNVPG